MLRDKAFLLAKKIRLVIFDVDGVWTDGSIYLGCNGESLKRFNILDGHGIKLLQQADIEVGIISARNDENVNHRMKDLGIKHIYLGEQNKQKAFSKLKQKLKINDDVIAYVGDDLVDLPIMTKIIMPIAVFNAHTEVINKSVMVTKKTGGNGAVREVCDFILKAQGKYDKIISEYLSQPLDGNLLLNIYQFYRLGENDDKVMTSFQEKCYQLLKKIPRGRITTYSDLAQAAGKPGASRAVGTAMAKNPYAPRVPCHRVIKSDGSIGDYALGRAVKIKLLTKEGLKIRDNQVLDYELRLHKF